MYYTPIAEGFGLISILAGLVLDGGCSDRSVDENNVLRGATLSGKLTREVRVSINVLEDEHYELSSRYRTQYGPEDMRKHGETAPAPHLEYKLDGKDVNGRLRQDRVYY